jgi:hypothetical protein
VTQQINLESSRKKVKKAEIKTYQEACLSEDNKVLFRV